MSSKKRHIIKVDNKVDNKKLNKSEEAVVRLLLAEPFLTVDNLVERTGLSASGVKKVLTSLKSEGLIARVGSRKSGSWRVLVELNK